MTGFAAIILLMVYQVENPYPSLKLGYEVKETKPRRQIIRKTAAVESSTVAAAVDSTDLGPSSSTTVSSSIDPTTTIAADHDYYRTVPCSSCDYKDALIKSLHQQIAQLPSENQSLKNHQ